MFTMKKENLNAICKNCSECQICMEFPRNFQMRSWVDCDVCIHRDYTPSVGAYWCKKYGGYDPRGGCSMGVEG